MKTVQAHGASIPALGIGTWRLRGREAEQVVQTALDIGYRHVDTAEMYENEEAVGRAIRKASVPRDDVFVTTKIWPDHFSKDELPAAVNASLKRLGMDYVDLLLLHWPNPGIPLEDTLGALIDMRGAGKARHIGVSNFTAGLLENACSLTSAPLVADEVEYHPLLDQSLLLDMVRDSGMALIAYSPLAKGKVVDNETLQEIAEAHSKSPAQVSLRWLLQQDQVATIPKASSRAHLQENFDVFDFQLSDEEMARIFSLGSRRGRLVNPARWAPDWGSEETVNQPTQPDRDMSEEF